MVLALDRVGPAHLGETQFLFMNLENLYMNKLSSHSVSEADHPFVASRPPRAKWALECPKMGRCSRAHRV